MQNPDLLLSSYDYELPEELIAQTPAERREDARLLVYQRDTQSIQHSQVSHLGNYLRSGDLLVLNNTAVFPARIFGLKGHTGTRFEFLLSRQIEGAHWFSIARNSKRIRPGYRFLFPEGVEAEILACHENGQLELCFEQLPEDGFWAWLQRHGEVPYPPYITAREADDSRYQTVFSQARGSVAAPTAGLHFSEALLAQLKGQGVEFAEVTLHVGIGTFSPVRTEQIEAHEMHAEWYSLSEQTAQRLNQQRQSGGRIIAVGTTATRTLESVYRKFDGHFAADSGETRLFVYPGQALGAIDGLMTNFHLPRSSLMMLVSAWIGRENLLALYGQAVREKYRFFSFGDATLLL